jgi:hypothetical protein
MLYDFLKGRTFSILRCLQQVHELGTQIEVCELPCHLHLSPQLNMITEQILKESQLLEISSRRFAMQTALYPTSVVGF